MKVDATTETGRPVPGKNEINTRTDMNAKNTHEDQRGCRVFVVLYKIAVILVGFMQEVIVEFDAYTYEFGLKGLCETRRVKNER